MCVVFSDSWLATHGGHIFYAHSYFTVAFHKTGMVSMGS